MFLFLSRCVRFFGVEHPKIRGGGVISMNSWRNHANYKPINSPPSWNLHGVKPGPMTKTENILKSKFQTSITFAVVLLMNGNFKDLF